MKSAGVFLGGLTSVLACNLIMVGVCSSAVLPPAPVVPQVPNLPPAVVRLAPVTPEYRSEPLPWGTFIWGCGGHISVDLDGALALPLCGLTARR